MQRPNQVERDSASHVRHRELSQGLRKLPNLFFRSLITLGFLYGALGILLVTAVETNTLDATFALIIGISLAVIQFILGPFILDLSLRWIYTMKWVEPAELPDHLRQFVQKVCQQKGISFPAFGIIEDGGPQAFTYGHYPGNARIVISRGLLALLTPEEAEAVVAHELGHICNWDMVTMTIANLVPLIAYYLYRLARNMSRGDGKQKQAAQSVSVAAYVVYIVSEFLVLWFSRVREYAADRFAGAVTGNPNALSSALVKIGYGLAATGHRQPAQTATDEKAAQKQSGPLGALGALSIFDQKAALNLVVASGATEAGELDKEKVKDALQWDLWNPWATYYEIQSTHPLIAKRLEYLCDQAAGLRQEPLVVFDRAKPESFWDEFIVDLCVFMLPIAGIVVGLVCLAYTSTDDQVPLLGAIPLLFGIGSFIKTLFAYRARSFAPSTTAQLLKEVKVSPVRPVAATLTGTIVGKGVPGLLFSEDFILRDSSGIIFLDYTQPIPLWSFFFGLLRAGKYQGKDVEVTGWFRRGPVPYLEVASISVIGTEDKRRCYTKIGRLLLAIGCIGLGIFLLVGQLGASGVL